MDDFESELTALLPRLRRFGRSLTRDHADADDLVQRAIERALRSRTQWRAGTRMDSWMYRIMQNIWIDDARANRRRGATFATAEAGEGAVDDARPAIEARIEVGHVARALAALPDEQRLAVALVLVEGLSYKEAAEVMAVPMGTLTSRLARGRQALLARFEEVA